MWKAILTIFVIVVAIVGFSIGAINLKQNTEERKQEQASMECAAFVYASFNLTDESPEVDGIIELVQMTAQNRMQGVNLTEYDPIVSGGYLTYMKCLSDYR